MSVSVRYEWRGLVADEELEALHASGFGHEPAGCDWLSRLRRYSLGWVSARTPDGDLAGFVNVPWDGGAHAFLVDTVVADRVARQGVGTRLVSIAASAARDAGCEWLHVDFEDHLAGFYLESCGFRPTQAGLIQIRPLPRA